ncbi:glycosyltransferase family 4 protein [Enterobacter hormaechei]|uniref:glycosyltransferase family 4 protein n=3 Tax=Enterobacter cloacae complex TaxID=354276 RepID=UPI000735BCF8|nr:glycosyltransferase family 4 protein [Enterobacter hormaechei]KTI31638.1 glycosyl transferase [Enterobacter hormaechei subsp. xiangfangensis]MCE1439269.1 glycosyltransferase family 4 protein [Enterobacter hormaechei]MDF3564387.1 glycosyltransferase family 4 protein [Enterobacter hormaechei]MEB6525090.1 glycosyltransferase family 4 protein [Enterobacter hormaechei]HBM2772806.1 glycosyltransferase family 4 protein [Enterobacter hormaechei subsp. xiangfangensis]
MDNQRKLHIALVANTLWSVYNFRRGLINSFIGNGHKVTIIAPIDDYAKRLEELGCSVVNIHIASQGMNPFTDLVLILKLKKIYSQINPDFIFHYTIKPNIYGSIAAWLSNKKSIAVTTGLGFVFNKSSFLTKVISQLYSFSFNFPKEVWFLNEDDKAVFISKKIIKEYKSFVLDGEGVDTQYFYPVDSTKHSDDSVTFLLVARMLWDKGVGIYVEAARKLKVQFPNAKFQLLGACDVENPSAIPKDVIDSWNKEGVIEYLGVTSDVRQIVSQADCVVLPSYYREGIPRTLMEAASMGKPLVTTDNVGCRNVVIEGVTGYLCQVKNVDSLVDAMRNLIQLSPEARNEMGTKGREFMLRRFDEKIIISDYYKAIEKYI